MSEAFKPNWIKIKGVNHPQFCIFCGELKKRLTGKLCLSYGYRNDELNDYDSSDCQCKCHKRFPF